MADKPRSRPQKRAPTGRLERFARLSGAATGAAARIAGERLVERFLPQEKRQASRQRALTKSGQQIVRVMGDLKGAAMKIGQMMSINIDELPPEMQQALSTLQRSAPAMEYRMVVEQIETALDRPISNLFRLFDPEPVGAASIGQVHRAETRAGRAVAVKVQYPGIAATIDSDVRNLASLLTMAGVVTDRERIDTYVDEVRAILAAESDYLREADNLLEYRRLLARYPDLVVPAPDLERSATTVLTMDFIEGTKLDDHLAALPVGAERDRLAERFVTLMFSMLHELHVLHADPHPGNFLVTPEGRIGMLDFGCVRRFPAAFDAGIIELLQSMWTGDAERLAAAYRSLGFGGGAQDRHDPELLYELSEMILRPFLDDEPFHFGGWEVTWPVKRFMLEHLELMTFTPPREFLLFMRVLAGLRGLLVKLDVTFNACRMAREFAALPSSAP
ncbi:MAG: AarF/ABC1/UbiB kinase family protein [Deltaproteobacteria bacterium]|nr:AarF/ABC1/UbiB kinase family protein [Deltaproteobacteria bacterium]